MCTVGAVINKQEQEMKEIDEYNAPEGYVAVEPMQRLHNGSSSCNGCLFITTDCSSKEVIQCCAEGRADKQDVIFKHKDEISDSLKTALGNLPLALERFQYYKKEATTLHHD
jgi:hypothetical protein